MTLASLIADTPWMMQTAQALLAVVGLSIVLATWRLLKGPSLPDRVLAMDVLLIGTVAVSALVGLIYDQPALVDVALVLALSAFLSTVALVWYMQRSRRA